LTTCLFSGPPVFLVIHEDTRVPSYEGTKVQNKKRRIGAGYFVTHVTRGCKSVSLLLPGNVNRSALEGRSKTKSTVYKPKTVWTIIILILAALGARQDMYREWLTSRFAAV